MDEINLPWYFGNARDWPVPDKTAVKESLSQLIQQAEKLLPPMLIHELPLWLAHFEKIRQGRWKYLIARQSQAQALFDTYQFRRDNPQIADLPLSRDALEFGLQLGIQPNEWPDIKPNDLREKLHTHLRQIRADAMLASLDVDYLRAIALVTVPDDEPSARKELGAMISLAQDEMQNN
jgi:hypothetical protein